nr:uncharacterized protein LOC123771592 [Procambarus clarkii]
MSMAPGVSLVVVVVVVGLATSLVTPDTDHQYSRPTLHLLTPDSGHDYSRPTVLRELDQLVIPLSTLVGAPPTVRPGNEKRAVRRFRTTSSSEVYQVCTPSRHEVILLLVALHEARQGRNMNKIIRLCNRQTNAADIDTNIRFLG